MKKFFLKKCSKMIWGYQKNFKNTLFVTCGSKGQLMDRLAKNYATVSHVDRKKELQKMLKQLCQRNGGGNQVKVSQITCTDTPCAHRGPRFAADSRSISWLAQRSRPRSLCTFCLSPSRKGFPLRATARTASQPRSCDSTVPSSR